MSISDIDATVIGAACHGHAIAIDESGFRPEWMSSDTAKAVLEAEICLARQGKTVNPLNVMPLCRSVPRTSWGEIIPVLQNGYGDVDWKKAVEAARQEYTIRKATWVATEIHKRSHEAPGNVEQWLPEVTTMMVQLIRDGDTYDPRPSAHAKKRIPQVMFRSHIPVLNDVMRGGYRNGQLQIYAGVTKHGKTTTIITHVIDCVLQGKRVALIKTENTEQSALMEIVRGMTGVTDEEIATGVYKYVDGQSPEDREYRHKQALALLEEYLVVYDWKWMNDQRLERIARWYKPEVLCIDYLKKQPGMFVKRSPTQDEVGDFADWLLVYAKENGICVITAGQIADGASKKILKGDTSEPVILYGSARVGYASDIYSLLKRHHAKRNMAYFRVWLDRFTGVLDTVHEIALDPVRRILQFPKEVIDKMDSLL